MNPRAPRDPRDLRVAMVFGKFFVAGPDDVRTDAGTGRVIDVLTEHFPRLRVAGVHRADALVDHKLALDRDRFVTLPYMSGIAHGVTRTVPVRRAIRDLESESDVVVVQLAFSSPFALLAPRTPRVYHVVSDVVGVVASSAEYGGLRHWPARALAVATDRVQGRLIARDDARAVTNGSALLARYGAANGRSVVSSTLLDAEVASASRQRPADAPFQLLYVGQLRSAKGIDTLLKAYVRLLDSHPDAELRVVGPGDIEGVPGMDRSLVATARSRGSVSTDGAIAFGPELFQVYADADVTVLPTREGEGTPRVLVEARAFGCPVVSTRVSGVPDSVDDGVDGVLVGVDRPDELAAALARLAEDPAQRDRLGAAGLARVRAYTVERYVEHIADEVERVSEGDGTRGVRPARASNG